MKSKKILSIFLVVIVISTLVVPMFSISTYASDSDFVIYPGDCYLFNAPLISDSINDLVDYTVDVEFKLLHTQEVFVAINFRRVYADDSCQIRYVRGDNSYKVVYDIHAFIGLNGWSDNVYRFIEFTSGSQYVNFYDWLLVNGQFMTFEDSSYYSIGYNSGYSDGYYDGYNVGEEDGIIIGENSSFGNNLLGDTLAAPVKALDSFVLYETSSGFEITLWGVFSTVLAVGLTIWFIKMFAGG